MTEFFVKVFFGNVVKLSFYLCLQYISRYSISVFFLFPVFFGYMRIFVLCAPPDDMGIFKTLSRAKSGDVGAC